MDEMNGLYAQRDNVRTGGVGEYRGAHNGGIPDQIHVI